MNDGRKIVDAELAAASQDRAHARALGAERGLGRSNRRLPLYGVSAAYTGAVPRSAGQVGCMATDGSRLPIVCTTMKLGTNATNSNTNRPNKDHPVPLGATRGHQSTTKRPVKFPVTPHALKLPGHVQPKAQPEIRAANQAHKGKRRVTAILVTTVAVAVKATPAARRFAVREP
jgi:hypothetical protein